MTQMKTLNIIKLYGICLIFAFTTCLPAGFTNSFINTAVGEIQEFIKESYEKRGWHVSEQAQHVIRSAIFNSWFICQMISFIFSPYITDGYGRRFSYILSSAGMTIGGIIQYIGSLTFMPELFLLGRAIAALCAPLSDAALILYIQESSPVAYRATFSFLAEMSYSFSSVLGMVFGMKTVFGDSLSTILFWPIIPGILFTLFVSCVPDTPKYLMIVKKNRKSALKALEFFQGEKKENEKLLEHFIVEGTHEDHEKHSSFKEILTTWHLRQAVFISSAVLAFTLPFYAIMQSSTYFFQHINIHSETAELASTNLMIIITVSSTIGSIFIDRFPRRSLVLIFGSLSTLFLITFVIFSALSTATNSCSKFLAMSSLFLFAMTYGLVLGPLSWFVAPELVIQKHKSKIFCFTNAICNCMIAISNFATISLYQIVGAYIFVPFFIIPSILCLVYLYLRLPETLQKETHEIIDSIHSRRKQMEESLCPSDSTESF